MLINRYAYICEAFALHWFHKLHQQILSNYNYINGNACKCVCVCMWSWVLYSQICFNMLAKVLMDSSSVTFRFFARTSNVFLAFLLYCYTHIHTYICIINIFQQLIFAFVRFRFISLNLAVLCRTGYYSLVFLTVNRKIKIEDCRASSLISCWVSLLY